MKWQQYEELCRLFIADIFEISIEEVKSVKIPSPTHPDSVKYKKQIDLYWKLENEFYQYINIADAKWRGSDNVSKMMAENLQFVKNDISNINKAILITNTDFDDGVIGIADKYGMGLYIVRPDFDRAIFEPDLKDRKIIQNQLQELVDNGKSVYDCKIIRRALDSETAGTVHTSVPDETEIHTKDTKNTPVDRMVRPSLHQSETTSIQKVTSRQGSSHTGGQGGSGPKGSVPPKGGGRTSYRKK